MKNILKKYEYKFFLETLQLLNKCIYILKTHKYNNYIYKYKCKSFINGLF